MKELKDRIFALCVFRDLWNDTVFYSLFSYIKHPSATAYAEFVSLLYAANGGNLGEYVKELCLNSENIYVRTVGAKKSIPSYMQEAVEAELDVLQEVSALDKETLCAPLKYSGFLPDFTTTKLHLKDIYMHRAENIEKYGYGIYAKHKMPDTTVQNFAEQSKSGKHNGQNILCICFGRELDRIMLRSLQKHDHRKQTHQKEDGILEKAVVGFLFLGIVNAD